MSFFEQRIQEWHSMKQFAILVVAVCAIAFLTSDAQAQRHGHGWHGGHHHHHHHGYRRGGGGFAVSIGSPYYGIGYSNLRPVYGGGFYGGGFYPAAVPVAPIHPWGGGIYGGGCGGYHRGGGAVIIGW
jgi:hypothetical protein